VKKGKIRAKLEALKSIEEKISEIAENDPLKALFILKNLKVEEGIDEKPLIAKIMLKLAEKLDFAFHQNHTEKAKILKSLLIKMIEELDVKNIYELVKTEYEGSLPGQDRSREELLEDTPFQEIISIFKSIKS